MENNNRYFLGTIYVSSPVAKIEVGVYSDTEDNALELLRRFESLHDYGATDFRVDPFLVFDERILTDAESASLINEPDEQ